MIDIRLATLADLDTAAALFDAYRQFYEQAPRMGAGKALLQAAEKLAVRNGKVRMDLTTARTNLPAQAAYELLGWVRDDAFYGYKKTIPV